MRTWTAPAASVEERPLARQMTWWVLVLPAAMLVALCSHSIYVLDYTHVLAGALWTGADIFLGFILGPVMQRLGPDQRRAVIRYLVPRMLLYMPIVAATTGTAGWFLSSWLGFIAPSSPDRLWIYGALIVTTLLAILGLGVLLPNNLRIYRQMRSPEPDAGRIVALNRTNMRLAGFQGALQVIIILIMARLVVG